jgi:hypothetical protein
MRGAGRWVDRLRDAVVAESRRHSADGEIELREARALDDHRLEFRFAPRYLRGWFGRRRVVVLTVDGRRRFGADFLVDEPDEQGLAVEDWPIEESSWRIFLLGMHEPFAESELVVDARGRLTRPMTD